MSLAERFSYWARYGDNVFGCEVQLLGMLQGQCLWLRASVIGHVTETVSLALRFSYWACYGDNVFGCEVQLLGTLRKQDFWL